MMAAPRPKELPAGCRSRRRCSCVTGRTRAGSSALVQVVAWETTANDQPPVLIEPPLLFVGGGAQ
jgi:hypothetical protein